MNETGTQRPSRPVFIAGILAVAALAAVSVAPSVGGEFLDLGDVSRVLRNPRTESIGAAFGTAGEGAYTPLAEISFAVDRAAFGRSPLGFRIHSMLAGALLAALAALVAAKLTGSRAVGLAAGAIFAVHPLCVEPSAWIAARPVIWSASFIGLSMLAYLPGDEGTGKVRPGRLIGALALYAAAMLTHPLSAGYPLVLLALAAAPCRDDGSDFARRIKPVMAFFVPGLALGIALAVTAPPAPEVRELELPAGSGAMVLRTAASTGRTLLALAWPMGLSPDYSDAVASGPLPGILGLIAIAALAAGAVVLRRRVPELALLAAVIAVTVVPAAALTSGLGGDRYAVFAVIAAALLAARLGSMATAKWGPGAGLAAGTALGLACTVMLIGSIVASSRWTAGPRLWQSILERRPESPLASLRYGRLLSAIAADQKARGKLSDSEASFAAARDAILKAASLGASQIYCRLELGNLYFRWGAYGQASDHLSAVLDKSEDLLGNSLISRKLLADVHVAMGSVMESSHSPLVPVVVPGDQDDNPKSNLALARSHFMEALLYEPNRPDALWRLGRVLNKLGETDDALTLLRAAAEMAPDRPEVHFELGRALENSFLYRDAKTAYEKAYALDEGRMDYRNTVARIMRITGAIGRARDGEADERRKKALAAFKAAMELERSGELLDAYKGYKRAIGWSPGYAPAHRRAGLCAHRLERYEEARQFLMAADLYQPADLVTLYLLGKTELNLGRPSAAEERFIECIRIDRTFGPAHLQMGTIIGFIRDDIDVGTARAYLGTALRLGTPGAARLLDKLDEAGAADEDREGPAPNGKE